MRVLLAFDKFKDSMTALQACAAAERGVRSVAPDAAIDRLALADGGDGFLDAVARATAANSIEERVRDPLLRPVESRLAVADAHRIDATARARFGIPEGVVAVVEMALASGLMRLAPRERDPMRASSRGTGDLLAAAAARRPAAVVLGVGGSASNDLGLGALEALGLRAFDANGSLLRDLVPAEWPRVERIEWTSVAAMPPIFVACDVTNPLLGERGATATFAPQKGLPRDRIVDVDREAGRIARLLLAATGAPPSLLDEPGGGAAGGIAFGLRAALGARTISGFDFFAACTRLDERLAAADIVVSGEGRFDATSLAGKGPGEVLRRALAAGKRAVVVCGALDEDVRRWLAKHGVAATSLADRASSPETAMRDGERLLEEAMAELRT